MRDSRRRTSVTELRETVEASEAEDPRGEHPPDGTLGGYLDAHDRPPSFEGSDGHPYTVSIEIEKVGDLRAPFGSYLVFPRWTINGMGIVGHVQTPLLSKGRSAEEVHRRTASLTLVEVKQLLEDAIEEQSEEEVPGP